MRRDRVADGNDVRVAEVDVGVAVRVRFDAGSRTRCACRRSSSSPSCRSSRSAGLARARPAGTRRARASSTATARRSRVFSCATMLAPVAPTASLPPICSRCQCVLNSVWTCGPPVLSAMAGSSGCAASPAPLSTSTAPSGRLQRDDVAASRRSAASSSSVTGGTTLRERGATRPLPRRPPARRAAPSCDSPWPSDARDLAGAVGEALHLEPRLVQHRQQQVRQRRVLGQLDLLAALEPGRSRRRRGCSAADSCCAGRCCSCSSRT